MKNMFTKDGDIWFKRKLYGWGWRPATWQGWFVLLMYVLGIVFFSLLTQGRDSALFIGLLFILPVVLLTALLIFICYRKGEEPRWQWGEEHPDYLENEELE